MADSPATLLYRLQTVDQAIMQRRTRIKAINTAIGHSEPVRQAKKQVDAAVDTLKPWQTRARDLDLELKGIVEKMKAAEENLYSGRISNPKAMREIQAEIEGLKRSQAKVEDHLLEAMMVIEESQAEVDGAQKLLDEAETAHTEAQVDLLTEKEHLEAEIPKFIVQREAAAALIEQEMLTLYESLRPKKSGSVVALLKNGSCMSCQVEQTSSLVQRIMSADQALVYCAACGRILAPRP